MPRLLLDFSRMEGKQTCKKNRIEILRFILLLYQNTISRFKKMNSVERRNLKKILDEEDGLTKAAIRELPSNSKEDNQKKLKQQAVEILRKEHQAKSNILSNKSTKVQKNNKMMKPEVSKKTII